MVLIEYPLRSNDDMIIQAANNLVAGLSIIFVAYAVVVTCSTDLSVNDLWLPFILGILFNELVMKFLFRFVKDQL